MSVLTSVHSGTLRPLDPRRDLLPVSDLIETCFFSTMDEEGREYLTHIRRAGRDSHYVQWLSGSGERVSYPLHGYVWVQDNRVVGNVTLIPHQRDGQWIYLIANVAVHPDYRRLGIGRALTQRGIQHARDHRVSALWLQVRDDNPSAEELYRSLGFETQAVRSNWRLPSYSAPPPAPASPVLVSPSRNSDWSEQLHFFNHTYPTDIRWNLPLVPERFRPGMLASLSRWVNGEVIHQWAARLESRYLGAATLDGSGHKLDFLWLALDPESEEQAAPPLLAAVLHRRGGHRSILLNYPAHRLDAAFQQAGFALQNTLTWMKLPQSILYPTSATFSLNHT